jgi:glutamate dehydrogenase
MAEEEVVEIVRVENELIDANVPKAIASYVSKLSTLFSAMDLAQLASGDKRNIEFVAKLYFSLGVRLEFHWFLKQITKQPVTNHWQALARLSFREELDWQQRSLTEVILRSDTKSKDIEHLLDNWFELNGQSLERWYHILTDFRIGQTHEFAKFSVALRELMLLSINANN